MYHLLELSRPRFYPGQVQCYPEFLEAIRIRDGLSGAMCFNSGPCHYKVTNFALHAFCQICELLKKASIHRFVLI